MDNGKTVTQTLGPVTISLQDTLEGMSSLSDSSFDLAIADPPYGASSRAVWQLPSNHSLKGFGGTWKLAAHEWDSLNGEDSFRFALQWLAELKRLVKPTGSIWIHATYHNSGIANVACQALGLEIINEVIWYKRNAFPNLSNRRLTASHETILWVHTGGKRRRYRFNYQEARRASFQEDKLKEAGKQLRTVWDIPNNKTKEELVFGQHPTQKPIRLTERLLLISGLSDGKLLVPFVGSGTELVAGIRHHMEPVGFEIERKFFDIARKRIAHELEQGSLFKGAVDREEACQLHSAQ